jgi:hypothetical protein
MNIHLDLEKLRKRKVMVATLLFGTTPTYLGSVLALQEMFSTYGIPYAVELLSGESDISLARNKLTDTFLRSDCTDLLQVDNDVGFDAMDILGMLHFDKDVIGANCPRKQTDWNAIREAVLLDPSIMPDKLELMGATWMSAMSPDCKEIKLGEPLSVDSVASGFSLTQRGVFERLASLRPRFYIDENRKITDFWSSGVHNERWETEDYAFCRRFREIGGSVWICPWMIVLHEGLHTYVGDMATVLKHFSDHQRPYTLLTA